MQSVVSPFPPLLVNPSLLDGIVRRRARTVPPPPVSVMGRIPIKTQLSREYLNALRSEVESAEPVLLNVHHNADVLLARDAAEIEAIHILLSVQRSLSEVSSWKFDRDAIRSEVQSLVIVLASTIRNAKWRNAPLLAPLRSLAAGFVGELSNAADIVWVVSSDESLIPETVEISRSVAAFHSGLLDRGVDPAYALLAFDRLSRPFGPFSRDIDDLRSALSVIPRGDGLRNALAALADVTSSFSFRPGASPFVILLADAGPDDDWGDRRDETIDLLRSRDITVYILCVTKDFTNRPFEAWREIAGNTGGACLNFGQTPIHELLSRLPSLISDRIAQRGHGVVSSSDRHLPLGPSSADTVVVRFPDFSPEQLGLDSLPLETNDDFHSALDRVRVIIESLSRDRAEKQTLLSHFNRIVGYFDGTRRYRLDFRY